MIAAHGPMPGRGSSRQCGCRDRSQRTHQALRPQDGRRPSVRVRTGIPWRDLPAEYGPWGRAYDLFRRWQRDGTWHRIFTELQSQADSKELITWDINVDSTVCRAHQHAAGARKRGSCRRSRPAASPSSRTTMDSGARAAA
uniref:transposase n=1 Tax=Streptomyces alanosinicus TaxID=68171 RepID=UPI0027E49BF5|nr:transposase [Streptomyces alanosinicus]